jgi:hypothetical protein
MWREPFIYRIPSLFSYEDETGSPILEPPDVGIAVNAVNMDYDGETLQLRLLLTYTFAQAFVRAFARISGPWWWLSKMPIRGSVRLSISVNWGEKHTR